MDRTGWGIGMGASLRGLMRPVRGSGPEAALAWIALGMLRGIVILAPVVLAITILWTVEMHDGVVLHSLFLFCVILFFAACYAPLPAITGGMLYLPLVWWAARRWPRAGRAIAVACAPAMVIGALPWPGAWPGITGTWTIGVPVGIGLTIWIATLPLPAQASETR